MSSIVFMLLHLILVAVFEGAELVKHSYFLLNFAL